MMITVTDAERQVIERLRETAGSNFYGRITLCYEAGALLRIVTEETTLIANATRRIPFEKNGRG